MRSVNSSDKQFVFSPRDLIHLSLRDLVFKKTFVFIRLFFYCVYMFVYLMSAKEIVSFLNIINRKWLEAYLILRYV